jgi:hypothetical protein
VLILFTPTSFSVSQKCGDFTVAAKAVKLFPKKTLNFFSLIIRAFARELI